MTNTETRLRNANLIARYNALFAAKRLADWSLLFQPDCRFEVAYPMPPMPAVLHGREELVGFIGALADAVGDVRIDRQTLHHTVDPEVLITEHRLSIDLLRGGQYQNQYISVIKLRDGQIAEVREYYAFLASLA